MIEVSRLKWFQLASDRLRLDVRSGSRSLGIFISEAFWGYEGTGWYAAEFTLERTDQHTLQRIIFNSVSGHTKVWLNGIYLGEHLGPYLPFEFIGTPYLGRTA